MQKRKEISKEDQEYSNNAAGCAAIFYVLIIAALWFVVPAGMHGGMLVALVICTPVFFLLARREIDK